MGTGQDGPKCALCLQYFFNSVLVIGRFCAAPESQKTSGKECVSTFATAAAFAFAFAVDLAAAASAALLAAAFTTALVAVDLALAAALTIVLARANFSGLPTKAQAEQFQGNSRSSAEFGCSWLMVRQSCEHHQVQLTESAEHVSLEIQKEMTICRISLS